jgi:hypothetical protein
VLDRSPEAISEHSLLEEILRRRAAPPRDFCFRAYLLGRVVVEVTSDDASLLDEIAVTLGDITSDPSSAISLRATFRSGGVDSPRALLDLDAGDPSALTPDDLLLGLDSPGFPFRLCSSEEGWTSFAFLDDREPLLSFRAGSCLVWKRDRWRSAVGLLLLHRIYRLRRDAIFFHASSLDLGGQGVIFVGPKGAGKSTTALALATRNIPLLGDEIACYRPADGMLEPFRRPVGIKPGPRAAGVERSLRALALEPVDDVLRIDARRLFATEPAIVPLKFVVFLDPFAQEPSLTRVENTRDALASLQPVVSSLVSAPRTLRVFQMARMLSSAIIYRLSPGNPDATAELICRELAGATV